MLQSFSLKYFHQIVAAALGQHQAITHTSNCGQMLTNQRLGNVLMTNERRAINPIPDDTWKTVLTSYSFEKFVSK